MTESIIVALITGLLALAGNYMANRKAAVLMEYRLGKVEEKLDCVNGIEKEVELQGAEIKRHTERIKVLEEARHD